MFKFPYTNLHELNLDWILSIVKEATDIFKHGEADIQHAVETSEQALETAEQAAQGVIADGAVTLPKLNDSVLGLFTFIVSGRVNDTPIPKDSFVILRKSTIPSVQDGIYLAVSDIPANTILTDQDLKQPSELATGSNNVLLKLCEAFESGLLNIVDGDTATASVPAGSLVFIKNNEHGLSTGFYTNSSGNTFPTSGGTADSSTFTRVSDVLNTLNGFINTLSTITGDGVLTGFTATDLTGAANELKNTLNSLGSDDIANDSTDVSGATVTAAVDNLNTSFQSDIAIILQDPAQKTIDPQQYVVYNNLLYKAKKSIPFGTAATTYTDGTYLEQCGDGGLNDLELKLNNAFMYPSTTPSDTGIIANETSTMKRVRIYNNNISLPNGTWTKIGEIPSTAWTLNIYSMFRINSDSNKAFFNGVYFNTRWDINTGYIYVMQEYSSSAIACNVNVFVDYF